MNGEQQNDQAHRHAAGQSRQREGQGQQQDEAGEAQDGRLEAGLADLLRRGGLFQMIHPGQAARVQTDDHDRTGADHQGDSSQGRQGV